MRYFVLPVRALVLCVSDTDRVCHLSSHMQRVHSQNSSSSSNDKYQRREAFQHRSIRPMRTAVVYVAAAVL
jgi:hypothetical protein